MKNGIKDCFILAYYIDADLLLKDISESVVFSVRDAKTSPELRGARKIIDRIENAPMRCRYEKKKEGCMMATSWKSQQGKGEYALQFETDDEGKYKLVEKAAQMAMDGKTVDDLAEVKHGYWIGQYPKVPKCSVCSAIDSMKGNYCRYCGAEMGGRSEK